MFPVSVTAEDQDILKFHRYKCNTRGILGLCGVGAPRPSTGFVPALSIVPRGGQTLTAAVAAARSASLKQLASRYIKGGLCAYEHYREAGPRG